MDASHLFRVAKRVWRLFRSFAASFLLVACVFLIALWADSYRKRHYIVVNTFDDHTATSETPDDLQMTHSYIASQWGTVMFGYGGLRSAGPEESLQEGASKLRIEVVRESLDQESAGGPSTLWLIFRDLFRFRTHATGWGLIVPHWFLLPIVAVLALMFKPRPRFRFSLRDLIFVTSVAALSFGSLVAFYRAYSVS